MVGIVFALVHKQQATKRLNSQLIQITYSPFYRATLQALTS